MTTIALLPHAMVEYTIGTITQEQGHFWYQMGRSCSLNTYFQWTGGGNENDLNKSRHSRTSTNKEFWKLMI